MDPERSWDGDYEGYSSAERRDTARRQRALMFRWRLLCSGQDAEMVSRYSRGEGLSFQEGQRLDDDLRIDKEVLTWRQLQDKCGHSLSHYVAAGKHLRVPSIETLVDMADVGGAEAVANMLREREELSEIELKRLSKSPALWSKVQSLTPELLPVDESSAAEVVAEQPQETAQDADVEPTAALVQLPLPQSEVTPAKPANSYFGWEHFLEHGGPIGFEVDTFSTKCVGYLEGTFLDDCTHEAAVPDYSPPAYMGLLSGRVPEDSGDALIQDLHLGTEYAEPLRDALKWWNGRRWGATLAQLYVRGVSSRILDNLFPDHHNSDKIQAGYRLLQSLFFPQQLQDGWGPVKRRAFGAAVLHQYYGPSVDTPSTWLKVHVGSLDPPTVYLHFWPSLSPKDLLWGRVTRDLWGGLLAYCPKEAGHWFYARPGQTHCGLRGHWHSGLFVTEPEHHEFAPIVALPDALFDKVTYPWREDHKFLTGMEELVNNIGQVDERFVEPPLARSLNDINGCYRYLPLDPLDHQLHVMKDLIRGLDPEWRNDEMGRGAVFLFGYIPECSDADPAEILRAELPWPHYVQYGGIFPVIRLFSKWNSYPGPPRYAPASLLQVMAEAVASEAIETSVSESCVGVRWGPFWCARPGCSNLFVTERLQRDLRACVAPGGFRSLVFSQYCSHACFIADKLAAKPVQNEPKPLRAMPDVRTFIERGKLLAGGGNG